MGSRRINKSFGRHVCNWGLGQKGKCLFLARDFAGIKPLFYGKHKNGFVFASQYNQLSNHPFFKNEKLISQF